MIGAVYEAIEFGAIEIDEAIDAAEAADKTAYITPDNDIILYENGSEE